MQITTKKLLSLIIFTQILFCVFFLFPTTTSAADSYTFKIPIPGFKSVILDGTTKPLAQYIEAIYKYAIGVVAILATIVMMIGGVVWITAAGDSGRIGEAKQYITGALTGLVLALCSFMILQTVDPDLVKFKAIGIEKVEQVIAGCCINGSTANNSTNIDCKGSFTPNKIASSDRKSCIAEADLVCCVIRYKSWTGTLSYKCFDDMQKEECKENGFLYDNPDDVDKIIVENRQAGSCAFYRQQVNCN